MNLLDLLEKKNPRIPRKKGQHRGSKSHSDLYTDENPKGTIKGLKFATVKDARASVSKIRNSGRSHAHKIQAAVAMEQRAREMGKTSQAAVYRAYINKMKKKTKKKNEMLNYPNYIKNVSPVPANQKDGEHRYYNPETSKKKKKKNEGWSDKYRESVMDKKIAEQKLNLFLEKNVPTNPSKWSYYKSQAKKKFDVYPSAYANAWAAKQYKAAGGGWKKG